MELDGNISSNSVYSTRSISPTMVFPLLPPRQIGYYLYCLRLLPNSLHNHHLFCQATYLGYIVLIPVHSAICPGTLQPGLVWFGETGCARKGPTQTYQAWPIIKCGIKYCVYTTVLLVGATFPSYLTVSQMGTALDSPDGTTRKGQIRRMGHQVKDSQDGKLGKGKIGQDS